MEISQKEAKENKKMLKAMHFLLGTINDVMKDHEVRIKGLERR